MKKQPQFINADRRRFVQKTTVASGAAVAGVAVIDAQAGSQDNLDVRDMAGDKTQAHAGYQLTDRVKEYYRKARF
ncbi:MAG: twin-arginine translocation signal domain-containing protein [Gammaproteobacteria bacterium]|nr:twin-arginine translocation signal domain-containing protein [Gammaproteobacteria bacterium]